MTQTTKKLNPSLYIGFHSNSSYVYIWYSKIARCAYVGETGGHNGVIGRAQTHLWSSGTIRKRFEERGIDIDDLDDMILLSYQLPETLGFIGDEVPLRKAVEYCVHNEIAISKRFGDVRPIANVDVPKHMYREIGKRYAAQILDNFYEIVKLEPGESFRFK